jgi:two-component system, OmpR family, sensor histidine kinase KdpD
MSRHPQDLAELIGAVVDRVQVRLAGRQVTLEIPEELPPVSCDYTQIDQVVTNLLENAVVHTPPGTAVIARAQRDNGAVRVEIVDRGPGIPSSDRERLFRPFERGHTRAPGTGLGLTIARGFVEAHGGHLWVEAAEPGSRFVFTLPA